MANPFTGYAMPTNIVTKAVVVNLLGNEKEDAEKIAETINDMSDKGWIYYKNIKCGDDFIVLIFIRYDSDYQRELEKVYDSTAKDKLKEKINKKFGLNSDYNSYPELEHEM